MRWILGIDVRQRARGALELARWLADARGAAPDRAFVAVHVLHEQHLRMMLRYHHLDEVVEAERAAAARQLAEAFPAAEIPLEVVQAATIDEGLEEARARHGANGVIVARAAPRESRRPFPLGHVARRLLRRLSSPVIVVPPDLTARSLGSGPVVALTSLSDESLEACRLARALAEEARRELAIVHVQPEPRAAGEAEVARWVSRHQLWPEQTAVLDGDVAPAALAFAEARGAPLVAIAGHGASGVLDELAPRPWRTVAAHTRQPALVAPGAEVLARPRGAPEAGRDVAAPPGPAP